MDRVSILQLCDGGKTMTKAECVVFNFFKGTDISAPIARGMLASVNNGGRCYGSGQRSKPGNCWCTPDPEAKFKREKIKSE